MPAPQSPAMRDLAKTQFRSFRIKVPNQPPKMNLPRTFDSAFKAGELSVAQMPMPPALFLPDSNNKYHVDTQKQMTENYGGFIDGVCGGICDAWAKWQSAATLVGVVINGPLAAGGNVLGPPLTPLILASAPSAKASEANFSNVIAKIIGTAWDTYAATLKVPGLPWYPAFAAFPGPVGPPMPNTPCPVAQMTQVITGISKAVLKAQMIAELAAPASPHHVELFDSIAHAFEACFRIWQSSTMVTNVLGMGPVPAFAPPITPAGPVVGGLGNMTPGGFV